MCVTMERTHFREGLHRLSRFLSLWRAMIRDWNLLNFLNAISLTGNTLIEIDYYVRWGCSMVDGKPDEYQNASCDAF